MASAYYYNSNVSEVLVCSDDLNCKFISRNIFGLPTKGVSDINLVKNLDEYLGYKELTLSDEEMSYFYCHTNENIYDCILNEYLIIKKSDGEVVDYRSGTVLNIRLYVKKQFALLFLEIKLDRKIHIKPVLLISIFSNTMTAITGHAGSGNH